MSGASTSTYPENLGSGGQLPAELRGRVCLFLFFFVCQFFCLSFFCLSVTLRCWHRKPRRCVYALHLGGTGISPRTVLVIVPIFVFVPVFVLVLVLVLQQAGRKGAVKIGSGNAPAGNRTRDLSIASPMP